ncbi:hypothetical protein HOR19_gp11 [Phage MedPE-SWcel-C56]|uniref:Uncharacterized protein n=1 Tax=Phage MedPE-SWcel-C56 TaxID=1871314 RepID=A0A1B1IY08_9CAUD|nr:hypothetical protein HOR19_gp11 [Phage MedPE-SWcel-C56]ANS06204.1 hypothetical protein [Phage MedPE-SWcel-C56]
MSIVAAALLLAASSNCGSTPGAMMGLSNHGEEVISQFVDDDGTAWRFWYDYDDGSYTITYTEPDTAFRSCMFASGETRIYRET